MINDEVRKLEKYEARLAHKVIKLECEQSLYIFFKLAWKVLEPSTPFLDNWHFKYLCNILQKEAERIAAKKPKTKDLIINIPPRSGKSYVCSVMFPAWCWVNWPHMRFITSSYANSLSIDLCKKTRDLIESEWYQSYWHNKFKMTSDQNTKSNYENDKRGKRFATSVSGAVTGFGADIILSDDILNPKDIVSPEQVKKANDYYDRTLYSRLDDQEVGLRVGIMQRLHEDDLTGHVLKKYVGQYEHICIPGELEGADVQPKELIKHYDKDGLFFPKRFTRKYLDNLKKAGRRFYLGQILQRPSEKEGNIFKHSYWKYYEILPDKLDEVIQSWDCAFKDDPSSSYVVGQVWGRKGSNLYLIQNRREHLGFEATKNAILSMSNQYPQARKKIIEDKANGTAIIEVLKSRLFGITPVSPTESKGARANAVSYMAECGNVYLPKNAAWLEDYETEMEAFSPSNSKLHDDQVDASTQAWYYFHKKMNTLEKYRKFVEK